MFPRFMFHAFRPLFGDQKFFQVQFVAHPINSVLLFHETERRKVGKVLRVYTTHGHFITTQYREDESQQICVLTAASSNIIINEYQWQVCVRECNLLYCIWYCEHADDRNAGSRRSTAFMYLQRLRSSNYRVRFCVLHSNRFSRETK